MTLTNEQLAIEIKNGKHELMEQLWYQVYGFIRLQSKRWANAFDYRADITIEDFTQSGYIALHNAVIGFDTSRNGGFCHYLLYMLKIEFLKLVGHYTSARDACFGAVSLEAPISVSDDIGLTLGDTIPDETDDYEAIDDELYHEWVSCEVRNAVKHLIPQQRDIIEKHYFQGMGMKEIANEYGISTQAISQKEKKGFQYLRLDKTLIEIAGVLLKTEPKKTYCYYSKTGFNAWRNYGGSIQERILLNY